MHPTYSSLIVMHYHLDVLQAYCNDMYCVSFPDYNIGWHKSVSAILLTLVPMIPL